MVTRWQLKLLNLNLFINITLSVIWYWETKVNYTWEKVQIQLLVEEFLAIKSCILIYSFSQQTFTGQSKTVKTLFKSSMFLRGISIISSADYLEWTCDLGENFILLNYVSLGFNKNEWIFLMWDFIKSQSNSYNVSILSIISITINNQISSLRHAVWSTLEKAFYTRKHPTI